MKSLTESINSSINEAQVDGKVMKIAENIAKKYLAKLVARDANVELYNESTNASMIATHAVDVDSKIKYDDIRLALIGFKNEINDTLGTEELIFVTTPMSGASKPRVMFWTNGITPVYVDDEDKSNRKLVATPEILNKLV